MPCLDTKASKFQQNEFDYRIEIEITTWITYSGYCKNQGAHIQFQNWRKPKNLDTRIPQRTVKSTRNKHHNDDNPRNNSFNKYNRQ